MLVYAFVLFLLVKGGVGQWVQCDEDPVPFCNKGIKAFEIPNSEQEFTELCEIYTEYFNCLSNYTSSCPEGFSVLFFSPNDFENVRSVLQELCANGSKLQEAFLSNVICLKITFYTQYTVCEVGSQSVVEDYTSYLRPLLNQTILESEQEMQESHSLHCLESLISVACVLHQVGISCGPLSKLSLLLLVRKSGFLLRSCSLADLENLSTLFISYLETKQDVKGMIEEAFWFESNHL